MEVQARVKCRYCPETVVYWAEVETTTVVDGYLDDSASTATELRFSAPDGWKQVHSISPNKFYCPECARRLG